MTMIILFQLKTHTILDSTDKRERREEIHTFWLGMMP